MRSCLLCTSKSAVASKVAPNHAGSKSSALALEPTHRLSDEGSRVSVHIGRIVACEWAYRTKRCDLVCLSDEGSCLSVDIKRLNVFKVVCVNSRTHRTKVDAYKSTRVDFVLRARKVDVRPPGTGNSKSHCARPVQLFITMIKWFRTSRLSRKNSLPTAKSTFLSPTGNSGTARAEDAQGTPTQSHISPRIPVYEGT